MNVRVDHFLLQRRAQELTLAEVFEGLFSRRGERLAQSLDFIDQLGLRFVVRLHELVLFSLPTGRRLQLVKRNFEDGKKDKNVKQK